MALKLDEVRALAERVAASHGLEVVDLEFAGGGGKHRTLRVFIEKDEAGRGRLREALERLEARAEDEDFEDGDSGDSEWDREWLEALPSVPNLEFLSGITHGDCEVFSRDFGTVLDVEDLVGDSEYVLEVSSPGLDRRLSTERDFERFQGSLVKLETNAPLEGENGKGQRKWRGRLAGVQSGQLLLTMEEAGNGGEKGEKKGRKKKKKLEGDEAAAPSQVAIPLGAIEKAHLVPEF